MAAARNAPRDDGRHTCGGCGQVATKRLVAWERAVSGGAGTANTLLSGESKHSLGPAPPLAALLSQQVVSTHRQLCEERKALPLTLICDTAVTAYINATV